MTNEKLKFLPNSKNWKYDNQKIQIVTNPKLWENSKTQIVTKLILNWDNSYLDNSISNKTFKKSFGKNNLTPWQPMRCNHGSLLQSRNVFLLIKKYILPVLVLEQRYLLILSSVVWRTVEDFEKIFEVYTWAWSVSYIPPWHWRFEPWLISLSLHLSFDNS